VVGPSDLTPDDDLPNMTDAMLGLVTVHHYSANHDSAVNKAYVAAFRKAYGGRPTFHSVAGYDAMHLIYEALKKTGSNANGDALVAAMKGMKWESPRGRGFLLWVYPAANCPDSSPQPQTSPDNKHTSMTAARRARTGLSFQRRDCCRACGASL
jgi:hypothetical protein